jgi:hypothetical protein
VYVVRLSVSIIIGLVHSIVILNDDQIILSPEFTNSSQGFFKSFNQFSSILKIPTSLVVQNLFFNHLRILKLSNLSHSKYKTTSTICSSVFGQAKFQSFVICHIIKIAVFDFFAKSTRISDIYFT